MGAEVLAVGVRIVRCFFKLLVEHLNPLLETGEVREVDIALILLQVTQVEIKLGRREQV